MNLGRNQLLNWINETLQCQYTSIEMLSDGVAYCQILDALHPNGLNLTRLNLSARYPDDCLRNLRILQSALKKLKITQPVSFQKISQGKFQDNIILLQWLYSYTIKSGQQAFQYYDPYSRRVEIMQRQNKHPQQMNPYLIPTQAYMSSYQQGQNEYQDQQQYDQQQNYNQQQDDDDQQTQLQQKKEQLQYRISQIKQDTTTLEGQMKTQMETNWKLMHNIERSIEQRNTLFLLLKQIQTIIKQADNSSVGTGILAVVQEIPDDFAELDKIK